MIPAIGSSQNESAFSRGKAMSGGAEHQRHDVVREARERRDDEEEDHQRRVHREEAVVRLLVEVLDPRLGQLGADEHREHPAGEEEEDRRHEVLDADHLVVGVDAEVVAPALGAVARVILGAGRVAERVVDPVVEGADAGEEADRRGDERGDEDDRLAQQDRIPAGSRPDSHDDPEADPAEEDEHPGPAQEPGAEQQPAPAAGRAGRVVQVLGAGGRRHASIIPSYLLPDCWAD